MRVQMTYKEKLEKFLKEEKARGVTYSFTRNPESKGDEEAVCKERYLSVTNSYRGTQITEL